MTYISTDGAEYDTTCPAISGIENGSIYHTTQVITVTDKNFESITVNGEPATLDSEGKLALKGNLETTYAIQVMDKAGNVTEYTVTMKVIADITDSIKDITVDDVKSDDKETIETVIKNIKEELINDDLTDEEKAELEDEKQKAEDLIKKIEEAIGSTETDNIDKVKDITSENVETKDKSDLEKAKDELEKALDDYKDNLTDDEKKDIQDEIDRIEKALEVIDKVEKVEDLINKFKDVHEPIIDRETFEQVQKLIGKTRRRKPKDENYERNMFCDLLYCADCGRKLWFNIKHDKTDIPFFSCGNYHGNRGTCKSTHYLRADAIEQVVMLELRQLAMFLKDDEETFTELLADKTNKDLLAQKKHRENELQKSVARQKTVENLYERLYEDNISGKVSDEWFMELSHKYEVERMELKSKISALHREISELDGIRENKEHFIRAIRKFMQMDTLTAPLLRELIERIDVYEVKGTGKNRTQQLLIHYKFAGCIDIPEVPNRSNFTQETRKGVAVAYIPKQLTA